MKHAEVAFLDSSVVLRWILGQPEALSDLKGFRQIVCSELLEIECCRVLDRCRLNGELNDEQLSEAKNILATFYSQLTVLRLNRRVLARARGAFATVVGTLDALHLSSALMLREELDGPVRLLTHDKQMELAARACGLHGEGIFG